MRAFIRRHFWCPAGFGPSSTFQLHVLNRLIEYRAFRLALLYILPPPRD